MLNVLLPMAGNSVLAAEMGYPYPSPLVEISGMPLIQRVIENLQEIGSPLQIKAVLRAEDCQRFHLDSTIKLLADGNAEIVRLQKETAGALCSVLMAVEHVYNDTPLVIANTDQIFDPGVLQAMMRQIELLNPDAACPTFSSVHPRWSYLRLDGTRVIEAIEKNPVSRHAVAGLYYFKSGKQFADYAMKAVLNGREVDGRFFISSALNEYILDDKNVLAIPIKNEGYHSFFTAQRVAEYERAKQRIDYRN
ncbi:MAG: glycosyltransferase family 2 protein [Aquirhabdus sp.]